MVTCLFHNAIVDLQFHMQIRSFFLFCTKLVIPGTSNIVVIESEEQFKRSLRKVQGIHTYFCSVDVSSY